MSQNRPSLSIHKLKLLKRVNKSPRKTPGGGEGVAEVLPSHGSSQTSTAVTTRVSTARTSPNRATSLKQDMAISTHSSATREARMAKATRVTPRTATVRARAVPRPATTREDGNRKGRATTDRLTTGRATLGSSTAGRAIGPRRVWLKSPRKLTSANQTSLTKSRNNPLRNHRPARAARFNSSFRRNDEYFIY